VEGLFIVVINGRGESYDLASYSGGEKTKINIAISEGLASLQKIGFRILDEAIVALDTFSADSFCEIMKVSLSKNGQIIIISHLPQIKELFTSSVEIVKRDGISTIKS
jgi:DNA repair exonuclease SbcCD ATPase subunit